MHSVGSIALLMFAPVPAEASLLERLAGAAGALVEQWGWWGVFIAMALQGAALPVASEITMMTAGWFLIQRVGASPLLIFWAAFVGAAGWVVGALVAYGIMATGGSRLLDRLRTRYRSLDAGLARADRWIARWGVWAAFIARLLPFGRTIITLPLGAARVAVVPFALATFAGAYLWAAFLAALGYLAGSQWERVQVQLGAFALPVALAVIVLLAVASLLVQWRRKARGGVKGRSEG